MGAKFGHIVTAETRAKISAAKRGRHLTPEHRAKIAAAGRKYAGCSVGGCTRKHDSLGLCSTHRMRLRMYGDISHVESRAGEDNPGWKGDHIGYDAAHYRAKAVLPMACALQDETCKGRLEAAFRRHDTPPDAWQWEEKSGRWRVPYSADPAHYWRLCRSHHVRLDHSAKNGA